MTYHQLYNLFKDADVPVSRRIIWPRTIEISGYAKVRLVKAEMDIQICKGIYLSGRNVGERLVQQNGSTVIVIARGLDPYWERLVVVKELMHIFDDPERATDSGEKFENLLNAFITPSENPCPQMESEVACLWMALGILCPETARSHYSELRKKKQIDDESLSHIFKLPLAYIPLVFRSDFQIMIDIAAQRHGI